MITSVALCEFLFNRILQGHIPSLWVQKIVSVRKTVTESGQQKQTYQKEHVDQQRNAKYSAINIGDCVLVKREKGYKLSIRFSATPYTVLTCTGTKVTA